jgi:uncharacterized lipoprotein YmbA
MNEPIMNTRTGLTKLLVCWLSLGLGACSGLLISDRPPTTTWWLEPLAPAGESPAHPGGAELSLRVSVVPGLDTDRILTLGPDAQLSHLAGARWADNLPEVLDSVLRRSLQASRGNARDSGECAGPGECCQVRVEFQEFFAVLDQRGEVESSRIAFDASMRCGGRGESLSGYQDRRPVAASSKKSVVAALQEGLNAITRKLRADLYKLADSGSE